MDNWMFTQYTHCGLRALSRTDADSQHLKMRIEKALNTLGGFDW